MSSNEWKMIVCAPNNAWKTVLIKLWWTTKFNIPQHQQNLENMCPHAWVHSEDCPYKALMNNKIQYTPTSTKFRKYVSSCMSSCFMENLLVKEEENDEENHQTNEKTNHNC